MDQQRPGLAATTRLAYQAELRGHLHSAAASFARAAEHSAGADLAFALVHRANVERTAGRLGLAEALYRQALRAQPDDPNSLAGLARIAVAQHDLSEATHQARRVAMLLPLPEHVTFLGELLLVQGNHAAARDQFAVAEATARLAASQGVNVDLELALFLADHGDPAAALRSARDSWRARHTVHTADALGWALHVNGKDDAALKFAQEANQLGTDSAQFLHHLGVIEADLGFERRATAHLSAALRADPGYSPWQQQNIKQVMRSLGRQS
jgi:tetratricopeptide (TPR) repeat protein